MEKREVTEAERDEIFGRFRSFIAAELIYGRIFSAAEIAEEFGKNEPILDWILADAVDKWFDRGKPPMFAACKWNGFDGPLYFAIPANVIHRGLPRWDPAWKRNRKAIAAKQDS